MVFQRFPNIIHCERRVKLFFKSHICNHAVTSMKVETGMMSGQTVSNGELYNVDYHMPQVQVPEVHFRGQALTDLTAFTWFTQAWISGLQYLTSVPGTWVYGRL